MPAGNLTRRAHGRLPLLAGRCWPGRARLWVIAQRQRTGLPGASPQSLSSPCSLDLDAFLQRLSCRCACGDPVSVLEPGDNSYLGQVDGAGYYRGSLQLVVHDFVYIWLAIFDVKSLARHTHYVGLARDCHRDGNVGIGQKLPIGVIDVDDDLANSAGAVGDHRNRGALDVSMPENSRLGVPLNLNRLANRETADLRLVKVCTHAHALQVCNLEQQLALFGKLGVL